MKKTQSSPVCNKVKSVSPFRVPLILLERLYAFMNIYENKWDHTTHILVFNDRIHFCCINHQYPHTFICLYLQKYTYRINFPEWKAR